MALLLAATVVLAGCSGGGNTSPTDASTDGPTPTEDGTPDASVEGDADAEASIPSTNYQWTEGESYSYETESARGDNSEYTWTVTDVSDGEVTVEIESQFGTTSDTTTVTGPQGNFFDGTLESQGAVFLFLHLPQILIDGQELTAGNEWTLTAEDFNATDVAGSEPIEVRVTGTDTVAGQECHTFEASDGTSTFQGCVKEDWPFALGFNASGSGDAQFSLGKTTLTDFNRP